MPRVEDFFVDLDRRWLPTGGQRVELKLIGSTALILQTDFHRGTKDSDVLETSALDGDTRRRLLGLAGRGSDLATQHQMFLEIVPRGLPFLRQRARWRPLGELNARLQHFDVSVLDVVDVVVSKLIRFDAQDRGDITAMIERDRVPHDELVACFREAVDYLLGDARERELPRCVSNLHQVERDMLEVPESEIELPAWI